MGRASILNATVAVPSKADYETSKLVTEASHTQDQKATIIHFKLNESAYKDLLISINITREIDKLFC